ncbi:MAG: chorismate synthase [Candidatus Rokubacteria bacterium 13_1_40CM_69_27]|nr:MAG: chorismate synthase [Candidatus Rokubacteria bacterium 13_1_40CM_69_27]OLC31928.1 MAG: chorismate synthase [Candidatus Rokubacteria bacterium 13_1_40CM_4_69_5]OLE38723.1 MAG: chorismate synthase [Candidatus Rokubacteria bacterium 13_1_20CM_2_70_7]
MFRFLTAGESHGQALTAVIDGVPAGLALGEADINVDLARRQRGYGRGGRMKIERDQVHIVSGVRWGFTLGSPITLQIANRDWENWQATMSVAPPEPGAPQKEVTRPRPGHADLAGAMKYGHRDIRNVLERSSARETTARVAVAGVAKRLLAEFGITVLSHVTEIGGVRIPETLDLPWAEVQRRAEASEVRCADPETEAAIVAAIDDAKAKGDTLGGVFEVVALGCPVGLGSYAQWDRRLDGRLAQAFCSIQAIKGSELGLGFEAARRPGSAVHDEILFDPAGGFRRSSNNAGGLEGGVTNGQPVIARAAMKPLSTLRTPLKSVDLATKQAVEAVVERSDVCAVPAAGVVGEAMMAIVLANAFLEKFGGDSLEEIRRNYAAYQEGLKSW